MRRGSKERVKLSAQPVAESVADLMVLFCLLEPGAEVWPDHNGGKKTM